MGEQILLTSEGLEKLQKELANLKDRRRTVADRIRVAREYGDLSENSEYEDAKNEQSFVEGRILELEEMIRRARVVAKNGNDKIELGSQVSLKMDGEKVEYELVGANESDPASGKISVESPIGHSLMGKAKGEKFSITTPRGEMACEVLAIR